MKFIHTSDWHLGRALCGRKRYEEFSAFLNWLSSTIDTEKAFALLVAGDIFDTSTPSNRAQELYYRFLRTVSGSSCKHIVVIGGNHDSPSFLNAPKELLRALNVHVVGSMTENPDDEVIVLENDHGIPKAIVCAVPYLRDRDIRTAAPGESIDDKNAKLATGLSNHYTLICSIAEQKQSDFKNEGHPKIPIIAMGHLFTSGGKTLDGDGVRELYVGSLAHVGRDTFPSFVDYVALGHLHVPQRVGAFEHIRYSGSPIPMGYGEATQTKIVNVVNFENTTPTVEELSVPCFQPLEKIIGSIDKILTKIETLKSEQSNAWLEIEYTGTEMIDNLRQLIDTAIEGTAIEIRRIINKRVMDRFLSSSKDKETLDDLDPKDVFLRCLDAYNVVPEERKELIASYNETVKSLQEEDLNAE